jgi:hypothetical protein
MLFPPACTFRFWQCWIFLGLLLIPMVVASIYFCERDPQLVERRLQSKEKVGEQKLITKFAPRMVAQILRCGAAMAHDSIRSDSSCRIPDDVLGPGRKQLRFADHSSRKRTARYFRWAFPDRSASDVFRGGISILFKPLALGSYWAVPVFALVIPVIVLRIHMKKTFFGRNWLAMANIVCTRAPG